MSARRQDSQRVASGAAFGPMAREPGLLGEAADKDRFEQQLVDRPHDGVGQQQDSQGQDSETGSHVGTSTRQ